MKEEKKTLSNVVITIAIFGAIILQVAMIYGFLIEGVLRFVNQGHFEQAWILILPFAILTFLLWYIVSRVVSKRSRKRLIQDFKQ